MSSESTDQVIVPMDQFLWLVVFGSILGFVYAFGIGANDVANSFASTVASGSLTLKQAVMVATVFEFSGAVLLGAEVTSTIRSKIFDTDLYEDEPEIVMLGMATSILAATILLLVATALGLPVSTTHTVVGAIMGFSISAKGFSSINWDVAIKIFISWVVSPGVGGILAFIFFVPLRAIVLRHEDSFNFAYRTFPVILFIGMFINVFYILYKGANNKGGGDVPIVVTLGIAAAVGVFSGLLWLWPVGPWVMKRISAEIAEEDAAKAAKIEQGQSAIKTDEDYLDDNDVDEIDVDDPASWDKEITPKIKVVKTEVITAKDDVEPEQKEEPKGMFAKWFAEFEENTYGQDLKAQSMAESHAAQEIWDNGEHFDPHAEQLFTYVQVFTACLNSFAHGANDVANAIAPISGMIVIYQTGELSSKAPVQKWVLVYGAAGIVLGLLLYGYKIMKSLGFKVTHLSPSRGSCAELASAMFVVSASFVAIPVSSTQTIVGCVAGVGLAGGVNNVEWWFLAKVCVGWVGIFLFSVLTSALCFSFAAYSPSLVTYSLAATGNSTRF